MQAERVLITFISTQECLGKELVLQPQFQVFHLQVFLFQACYFYCRLLSFRFRPFARINKISSDLSAVLGQQSCVVSMI